MGNSRIPMRAREVAREHGHGDGGHLVHAVMYEHLPWGDSKRRMVFILQYAEEHGRIIRDTRHTWRYSGRNLDQAKKDWDDVVTLLKGARKPGCCA